MKHRTTILATVFCVVLAGLPCAASDDRPVPEPLPDVPTFERDLERRDGLLGILIDRDAGRVYLEIPGVGADGRSDRFVLATGLAAGLGSNPVGLDRGQVGEGGTVTFRRIGRRAMLEQDNARFVAGAGAAEERAAVRESFATSILWAGPVVATGPGSRFVIDATSLVVRDAHAVVARLREADSPKWTLDPDRSAPELDDCVAFPDNVELEATVTFSGERPGTEVVSVTPRPDSVTLRVHQSFVRLPDDRFDARPFDPRSGSFAIESRDYAAPLDATIDRRFLVRHRLTAIDPAARPLVPVRPIVYHVDRGIPEPIRSAVLEGASWWSKAFEAAGWKDAFRVELLPEGVDPLDARYNVVQWVHRSTRGWSYGGGIVDPRTGERIKGHINLGSLRVRQDRLLIEGLVGADRTGTGEPGDPVVVALARIRQLAAHEVGHALGFDHNFAASTYADRASVMDYPAPRVTIREDGSFDLTDAYGVGVGRWDLQATRYAYGAWPDAASERTGLEAILRDNQTNGWLFLNDPDARPIGTAHPRAHLWDNGEDAAAELLHVLEVRRLALDRFDASRIRPGRPRSDLEEVLVPVYFHHRFQLEAAVALVGGLDYVHGVRGDATDAPRAVPSADQRRALDAVLAVLDPATLDIPESAIRAVPPRAPGSVPHRETFAGRATPAFDPLSAAASAAAHTLDALLRPERTMRLVDQHRRDPSSPGLVEVLGAIVERSFAPDPIDPRRVELARIVREQTVDAFLRLASDASLPGVVRSLVDAKLRDIDARLAGSHGGSRELARLDHDRWLRARIARWLERREIGPAARPETPPMPPGSPIGANGCSLGG